MESWIDSETLYKGKIFSLRVGVVRLEGGETAQREVIEHGGGVAVVPFADGKVTLVSQFRIAAGREIVELPGGRLEGDEPPADCARRELEEELGYHARELIHVSSYYTAAGYSSERMHLFLALGLERTKPRPERDELLRRIELPLEEVEAKLRRHELEDARTIIGLHELVRYLRERPGETEG